MVHASRYHEWIEDAFLHWLEDRGLSYDELRARSLDLVIGTTTIRYEAPARLDDQLAVSARASRSSTATVTVEFQVVRGGDAVVANATVTYIAVRDGKSAHLPDELTADREHELSAHELLARLHGSQDQFYAGGSAAALEGILHPDVSWHVPGTNRIAGDYVGRDRVIAYMSRRRDLAKATFRLHPGEVLVGTSHLAALVGGTAIVDGVEHEWDTIGLYRRDRNRIIECFLIPRHPETFDRIWS